MKPSGDHQSVPKSSAERPRPQTPKPLPWSPALPPNFLKRIHIVLKTSKFHVLPFHRTPPGAAEAKGAAPVVQKQVGTCWPVVTTPLPTAAIGQENLPNPQEHLHPAHPLCRTCPAVIVPHHCTRNLRYQNRVISKLARLMLI